MFSYSGFSCRFVHIFSTGLARSVEIARARRSWLVGSGLLWRGPDDCQKWGKEEGQLFARSKPQQEGIGIVRLHTVAGMIDEALEYFGVVVEVPAGLRRLGVAKYAPPVMLGRSRLWCCFRGTSLGQERKQFLRELIQPRTGGFGHRSR